MFLIFLLSVVVAVPILILAMVITSQLGGGVNFGNLGMVLLKSIPVLAIAHALWLVPFGFAFALTAMTIGFMIVFGLDLWEARMLVLVNWVLNFAVRLGLIAILS